MSGFGSSVHPLEPSGEGFPRTSNETVTFSEGNRGKELFRSVSCGLKVLVSFLICAAAGTVAISILVMRFTTSRSGCPSESSARITTDHDSTQALDQDFAFATYYQRNMVLQREPHNSIIWGYGVVGAIVNVSVNGTFYSTEVVQGYDSRGVWSVKLDPKPAGTRTNISGVHDNNGSLQYVRITNVLFGDVFVCSGQSNMQMTLSMIANSCKELEDTANYPDVRVFTVAPHSSPTPLYDIAHIQQPWTIPEADTMHGPDWTYFSGLCWLYGKYLHDELRIPIGLVASSQGATPVESWSSLSLFTKCFRAANLSIEAPTYASQRQNAMIHPLFNVTVKGVIWYQGESNTESLPGTYPCMFTNMIEEWRLKWHEGSQMTTDRSFPFGFVQIADSSAGNLHYPQIRWQQTAGHGYVPNPDMESMFMAIAMDLPDPTAPQGRTHPRHKQDIALRLVAGALSMIYNKTVVHEGPFPEDITETDDRKIVIQYPLSQELVVSDQGNFQICCQGQDCSPNDHDNDPKWRGTSILEHSNNTITIDALICEDETKRVEKVRYAWALSPCAFKKCSIYNSYGFPGPPFILSVKHETTSP